MGKWIKSSRSNGSGGNNCVEAMFLSAEEYAKGEWRDMYTKSRESTTNGTCVEVAFRKAEDCGTSTCVEVGAGEGVVLVRDSKNPEILPLVFTRSEWDAFEKGVKAGEFTWERLSRNG